MRWKKVQTKTTFIFKVLFLDKDFMKKVTLPYITFYADRHKYLCEDATLTSATGLISKYKSVFERDYWLTSGAIKDVCLDVWKSVKAEHYKGSRKPPTDFFWKCYDVMTPRQRKSVARAKKKLAHAWESKNAVACYRGTKFHEKMELKDINSKKGVKNPFTNKFQKIVARPDLSYSDNASVTKDLSTLEDGYYPELLIHFVKPPENDEEGIGVVGQVDRAWIWTDEDGVRWYASDDWKTNWDKRKGGGMNTFSGILKHLRETKTNEYALQASVYAYMMELFGFKVAHLQITYAKDFDDKTLEVQVLNYMKEEVENMFDEHFNN